MTKIEAAFVHALKIGRSLRCRKCGGGKVTALAHGGPDVSDPEVLQVWLDNKKLYFLEQDEELFLSGIDARKLVELLNDPKTPRWRGGTLFMALIYKVHDGKYANASEEKAARAYLKQHLDLWKDAKGIPFQIRKAVLQAIKED
ncbi:MAG: hypothetical protein Kow00114_11290 [Kiloniellaceae bacterium]